MLIIWGQNGVPGRVFSPFGRRGRQRGHAGWAFFFGVLTGLLYLGVGLPLDAQVSPVPFINQPLVPSSAAPGGGGVTLTVNGTGFVNGATVEWNGVALTTTFVSGSQLSATVPATNIAAPGSASITVVNPGTPVTSNVMHFPVAQPRAIVGFADAPGSPITIGLPYGGPTGDPDMPSAIIAADFNNDGKVDLAVETSVRLPCSTRIYLGDGDGTFVAVPAPYQTSPGCAPNGLAAGDFNGDGKLDLAVAGGLSDTITVLTGNGDGTFMAAPGSPFAVNSTPPGGVTNLQAIAVGDFNRDGKLDLALGNADSNTVVILLGNGDGTFATAPGSPILLLPSLKYGPLQLAVGDFNGDGVLDLAVPNYGAFAVTILLGNGDGSFRMSPGSPAAVTHAVQGAAAQIVAGDFNGDGRLDLALSGSYNNIGILLGNGDGTFAQQQNCCGVYSPLDALMSWWIGDFHGNGKLDLAMLDGNGAGPGYAAYATTMNGNGDGTFTQSSFSYLVPALMGNKIAIADFNGDGMLDAVVADTAYAELSVLLQTTPPPDQQPDFSITPDGSGTASVAAGATASFPFRISSVNHFIGQVSSFSCSGAPKDATCSILNYAGNAPPPAAYLIDTAWVELRMNVQTEARGFAAAPSSLKGRGRWVAVPLALVAMLLMAATMLIRRRLATRSAPLTARAAFARRLGLLIAATVLDLAMCTSCGNLSPPKVPFGTPAGTYTLTVTATSGGVSHSANLTLTVQ